jgi:O-antigen/teichoic acid export membrane protein
VFIPGNLNRVLLPYLYKYPFSKYRKKFQFAHDIYAKFYAVIAFYIFIVFFFFSREFIVHLFGEKYGASIGVLRIIAFGVPFIFTVSGAVITALDLQRKMTRYQAMAMVFNLAANAVLVYLYKAEGAALAAVLTYALLHVLTHRFLVMKRYISLRATLISYIKLFLITATLYGMYCLWLRELFFLYSFLIISICYGLLVILLLITRTDLRIVDETVGLKWIKGAFSEKILRRHPRRGSGDPPWG